ncbi:MAG: BstXI family restriction endonuclease, partial [Dolichospermum sp.]
KKSGISRCPKLLDTKIYKTGQTRGADDDVIYQNRVSRTSTVLIPYVLWPSCANPPNGELNFENGFIVAILDRVDPGCERWFTSLSINCV